MAVKFLIILLFASLVSARRPRGEKPGTCIIKTIISEVNPFFCSHDYGCLGPFKCCPTILGRYVCSLPGPGKHRPGGDRDYGDYECPRLNEDLNTNFCATNNDCRRLQRCCPNPDGSKSCKRVFFVDDSEYYG